MAEKGTTSLAPPRGLPAYDAEGAFFEFGELWWRGSHCDIPRWWDGSQWWWSPPPDPTIIILRWLSGNVVGEFAVQSVEEFSQHLDEGPYEEYGVTLALSAEEAEYEDRNYVIGSYDLYWSNIELEDGRSSRDYGMPDGAEVTLVLRGPQYPNL